MCREHGIFWKELSFADSCVWKLPFQLLKQERINAGNFINKALSPPSLSPSPKPQLLIQQRSNNKVYNHALHTAQHSEPAHQWLARLVNLPQLRLGPYNYCGRSLTSWWSPGTSYIYSQTLAAVVEPRSLKEVLLMLADRMLIYARCNSKGFQGNCKLMKPE